MEEKMKKKSTVRYLGINLDLGWYYKVHGRWADLYAENVEGLWEFQSSEPAGNVLKRGYKDLTVQLMLEGI
jgi:hypothetical protein